LLGRVMDDFRQDLLVATRTPRGRRTSAPAEGLRSSQLRMLSLTPVDGMRVTDLAERVGMTKQALGEFADDLEERGLLETVRDPADRRVRILRPTRRGRQAVEAGEQMIGEVEARWRERLGPRKWDQLRTLLVEAHEAWPGAAGA
jgi:DNA-binding MarR family transcriptional regulator